MRDKRIWWVVVPILLGTWTTGLAVDSWEDGSGHTWVSNSYLTWDVSHGSSLVVEVGTEAREWRYYQDSYNYGARLGSGGNVQHSPGYGSVRFDERAPGAGEVSTNADGSLTIRFIDTMRHDEFEYPLEQAITFYDGIGLVRVDYSVGNVTDVPNPPGLIHVLSLTPGGDKTNDWYFYSGKEAESPYPYGSWQRINRSEMTDHLGYVYLTAYDKAVGQGIAAIAASSDLADHITDINYGVAEVNDATHYANYSLHRLSLDATISSSFFLLVYEYDSMNPLGAIENALEAIAAGELPKPPVPPANPDPEPPPATDAEMIAGELGVAEGAVRGAMKEFGRQKVIRLARGVRSWEELIQCLQGYGIVGLGPRGAILWTEDGGVTASFKLLRSDGSVEVLGGCSFTAVYRTPAGREIVDFRAISCDPLTGVYLLKLEKGTLEAGDYDFYVGSPRDTQCCEFSVTIP